MFHLTISMMIDHIKSFYNTPETNLVVLRAAVRESRDVSTTHTIFVVVTSSLPVSRAVCLLHATWKGNKGLCCRLFGVYESVRFTSAGNCDWVKTSMFLQTTLGVCTHELDHIREGFPIYLRASQFPCNCVDETLAGRGVSARHI